MLSSIIEFSVKNKLAVLIFTAFIAGFGIYSLTQIPIGAVPDVTNNQVQVITTSRNLSTEDMEQFITYPVELEMANLPGVIEIRSISKFGLSVVTIVFEDDMGTYLPRQLIADKIESASKKIPEAFGRPEMGPITTGLGEIYQYILDVEPEYKDQYDAQDLRTIQDWIVKRQLSGIPGVVEVNTWGGFLKQYEVAIDTDKLMAMNISAQAVFSALSKNNSIAGGGYIEKVNQAMFIRGEGLVSSIEDIENIVVKTVEGSPIYIKDVAQVGFGNATRFGAITGNAEGEKVLGQVMMLKDANSKEVIDNVKQRVSEISKSLPEGVYINAFIDRSELIDKTTFTITENLVFGCLIVIFVVVLLLGNFRSGLVIASIIPLCLLFALSCMYIFGIDANLMSLGAIDFGIIIDGAVIIVEFIAFKITQNKATLLALSPKQQQLQTDKITVNGASKMMNSAIFGQLIILIVFIPILSLQGVEGKMFKPMALTFSFALIGAMIMCFTYVPVVSSMFLKPAATKPRNISSLIMRGIYKIYDPILNWALGHKKLVLSLAILLIAVTGFVFSRMGAEFVPTLDEGDFVIQPVLKTGTSLSKTVEITTEIERILLDEFPEVAQVVTRIGAAEVPTDPMSMEESDVIIILNPKNTWTSARTKDELADKFKEALAVIPGMEVEFTQPIEMRFNELITGVRADIAIKIFGEDLDILATKGAEIGKLIEDVPGAADITVEKIAGLPEINVDFDRNKIARYGLNIADLNDMIAMGFSGKNVGSVFEGEKRFDLVVRLNKQNRQGIDDIKNLLADTPGGNKIPLIELADISYQQGAAKISRDDTRRRMVVSVNVRNRDLQSVVDDIAARIENNVELPTGYTITYGGQFENLNRAKSRLLFAVPVALILIFILLYLAFRSVKEALMIYTAIPLAAVGGVWLLWLRDMPFSISAGVGFIALFGIAVLNGIVLIEHFKALRKKGITDMETLIKQGTKDRTRAVILTASAAALGFLPMAISTNVGAEVQRPLATVVIGGLITATLLTLIVLPLLYSIFGNSKTTNLKAKISTKTFGLLLLFFPIVVSGQNQQELGLDQLIVKALENNMGLNAESLKVMESEALESSAFNFDKTQIYYQFDEINMVMNVPVKVFGIKQDFKFPTVYFSEKKLNKAQTKVDSSAFEIRQKGLKKRLTMQYYAYQIALKTEEIYSDLDSLYGDFARKAARKFELGETNYLEKITAQSKQRQINFKYLNAKKDRLAEYIKLSALVQAKDSLVIKTEAVLKLEVLQQDLALNPELNFYQDRIKHLELKRKFEKQQLLPDLSVEYFQGSNAVITNNLVGYQLGVSIPLFFSGEKARIKSSKIAVERATAEAENYEIQLNARLKTLRLSLGQLQQNLDYYETEGASLSAEILRSANGSFKNGEIDFYQYIQSLEGAYEIQLGYLDRLKEYNNTVIAINYITY